MLAGGSGGAGAGCRYCGPGGTEGACACPVACTLCAYEGQCEQKRLLAEDGVVHVRACMPQSSCVCKFRSGCLIEAEPHSSFNGCAHPRSGHISRGPADPQPFDFLVW